MKKTADAVIVAAGSGNRSGLCIPKQFYEINGRPVLAYTIDIFLKIECINRIIVVLPNANFEKNKSYMKKFTSDDIVYVKGGNSRSESVFEGLKALDDGKNSSVVCIHDGVRMFVDEKIITESIDCALINGAALTAVPITDTVKLVNNGEVCKTVDRNCLFAAQTPQTFNFNMIFSAYKKVINENINFTDDCAVAEYCGIKVHITNGSKKNIKLTLPEDFENL